MLKVGLTGGIASGKSTVLEMLAKRGAHVLRADEVAHGLMAPGEPVYEAIIAAFGCGILGEDGRIVRARLAEKAFPERIGELNGIVHPAVIEFEERWMHELGERDARAVAVCEAALLIEAGGRGRYDRLVVVRCPLEMKAQRYAERVGVPLEEAEAEVRRRMAAQMPEDEKARMADFVIENDGGRGELEEKVEEVWRELKRAAG